MWDSDKELTSYDIPRTQGKGESSIGYISWGSYTIIGYGYFRGLIICKRRVITWDFNELFVE